MMIPIETVQKTFATTLKNGADLAEVYLEDKETLNLELDDGRLERPLAHPHFGWMG